MELPQTLRDKIFDIVEKGDEITVIIRGGEINEIRPDIDKFIYDDLNEYANKLIRFIEEGDIINKDVFKEMLDSVSLIDNSPFLSRFGLGRYVEIVYDLTNLDQTNKMLFNYALFGRGRTPGVMQNVKGRRIGKGVILIPYGARETVENFINGWNIKYSEREVLNFEWGLEDGNE